eukprot:comp8585_c0_seq1/m.3868 comp8585_c0_seq1/g.3868  ORF comp8585_c0_seq1/g.3868 comp8585_c0_seq1/m.3868 type:complete len:418 (-) comp8585_c0_seq1:297-1550(-)
MFAILQLTRALALVNSTTSSTTYPDTRCQPASSCLITCAGADNICFNTLGEAVSACPDYGSVRINGDIVVTNETSFDKNLFFVGCSVPSPRVVADFNITDGGMLRTNMSWKYTGFTNLAFERRVPTDGSQTFSTVLRTTELGNGEWPAKVEEGPVFLTIADCSFRNFLTLARGGAAIFLGRAGNVTIVNTLFENNVVLDGGKRWDGGGTIWIRELPAGHGKININNSTFRNNRHYFPHSQGAALFCGYCIGDVTVTNSLFDSNMASGGASIYMQDSYGKNYIQGTFVNNLAHEFGWGSRGGALWIQWIAGTTVIDGYFANNTADQDRAGVLACNGITGYLSMKGTFLDNKCNKENTGALLDVLGSTGFAKGATIVIEGGSTIKGNRAFGTDRLIRTTVNPIAYHESQWKGQTVTFKA